MSKALIKEIFDKYLADKYELGSNKYLLGALASSIADRPINYNDLTKLVQKVIHEQLYIDNIVYSLVPFKGKWLIHESYKKLLQKLTEKGWFVLTQPLSVKQFAQIENEGDALMANNAGVYPISTVIDLARKKDVAGIQLRIVTSTGVLIENKIYTAKTLLITAKKTLRDDGIIITDDRRPQQVMGPWNTNVSDYVEMLKKTAIRNTIKNLV